MQLIKGQFQQHDAIEVLTKMVNIKIKYHENKINDSSTEEDIKSREMKIKGLQNDLVKIRSEILQKTGTINVDAILHID
jgi:hypothetical protein